jgi:hypothetical protein
MPICRHKIYTDLADECNLIKDYITNFTNFTKSREHRLGDDSNGFYHRVKIKAALKPTAWNVNWAGMFLTGKGATNGYYTL